MQPENGIKKGGREKRKTLRTWKRSVHKTASIDEGHTQRLLEVLTVGLLPLCSRLGGLVFSG